MSPLYKQSFSSNTLYGERFHMIAYYSKEILDAGTLQTPSEDPKFTDLVVPQGVYPDTRIGQGTSSGATSSVPSSTSAPASGGQMSQPLLASRLPSIGSASSRARAHPPPPPPPSASGVGPRGEPAPTYYGLSSSMTPSIAYSSGMSSDGGGNASEWGSGGYGHSFGGGGGGGGLLPPTCAVSAGPSMTSFDMGGSSSYGGSVGPYRRATLPSASLTAEAGGSGYHPYGRRSPSGSGSGGGSSFSGGPDRRRGGSFGGESGMSRDKGYHSTGNTSPTGPSADLPSAYPSYTTPGWSRGPSSASSSHFPPPVTYSPTGLPSPGMARGQSYDGSSSRSSGSAVGESSLVPVQSPSTASAPRYVVPSGGAPTFTAYTSEPPMKTEDDDRRGSTGGYGMSEDRRQLDAIRRFRS